ncbi:hypothetical protein M0805_004849 [Coniferiporia weirii]|nr:hypothetical protein M0805_004849 [Coniferiporia weirii]
MDSEPTIRENHVLDNSTKLWIPYKTRSDALLAHLKLQENVPASVLDSVLRVIQDPAFDSTKVTLNTSADVDARISEYRHSLSSRRTQNDDAVVGMPLVVLEQVLDQIVEQMGDCVREALNQYPDNEVRYPDLRRRDLINMSLVHRAWTMPAQRALRRRVVLNSDRRLQLFLRSPHCGPWVQELIYSYDPFAELNEHGNSDGGTSSPVLDIRWQLLASLLQRLPNLRFLSIETVYYPLNEQDFLGFETLFPPLGSLTRLEGLCITSFGIFDSSTCPFLIALCAQLPRLQRLEYLHINNLSCDWEEMDSPVWPALRKAGPPPSLKTLSLELSSRACVPRHFLAWLLAPRGDYALDRLKFTAFNQPDHAVVPLMTFALDAGLASVKELYIKLPNDYEVGGSSSIISGCRELRKLYLGYSPTCPAIALPPSLQELRLYREHDGGEPLGNHDQDVLTLLTTNTLPALRNVTVIPDTSFGCVKGLAEEVLPLTTSYCRGAGVELHLLTEADRALDRMQARVADFLLHHAPFMDEYRVSV